MSLVGTRPPTVDEWELYEPHHRATASLRSEALIIRPLDPPRSHLLFS